MNNVFDAISWAIRVSRGEPMAARMLLIIGLAARVNQENEFVVWPSKGQMALDCDMSMTSVKKWLRYLEDQGYVQRFERKRENGTNRSNNYRLAVRSDIYHPKKGLMLDDEDTGRNPPPTGRPAPCDGAVDAPPTGRTARPPIEQPYEHQDEGRESTPDELDLGLPPVPPKDPTASDVADFIAEEWAARAFATPIRGKRPAEAAAEKALAHAKKCAVEGQTALDVWREIFERIDDSDFLQGKVPGCEGRPPFKLTLSFMLEKRNFEKTLEGRFNGRSSGQSRRGSTSEATGRVLTRLRSGPRRSAGGGNQALAVTGR